MRAYGKAIASVLFTLALAAYSYLNDNVYSTEEVIQTVIAFFTAVSVFLVPLTPQWPWMKSVIGAIIAGLMVLVTVILDGISQQDWWAILIAVLAALGITIAPAISDNGAGSKP